jgi:hypothetical protein
MTKSLPFLALALVLALPLHAADSMLGKLFQRDGVHVELNAVPEFVQRVFLPTVPGIENTFRVHGATVDAVLDAPDGFTCARRDGALVVTSAGGS